ncbi:MAG: TPM domain-containing protein [Clostridia bacterium]|nr:TPM domain-containing protein [Clostridia bacterium]
MPGPAGGGRSGGFGGGSHGGGSFGGGRGGSFGGGARPSGGFSGGHRPGGGFGGPGHGGFGGPPHRPPPHRPHYGPFFGRRWGRPYVGYGGFGGAGCAGIFVFLIFIVFFFASVILPSGEILFSDVPVYENYTEIIHTEIVEMDPLDEALCKPIDTYYECTIEDAITEENEEVLISGLKDFYSQTGVQPYIIFTNDLDGDTSPDYDTVNTYLYDRYIELFGEDEGHFILLYIEDENREYELWYISGYDAESIMDDYACDILLDNAQEQLSYGGDYAKIFSTAFSASAKEIMYREESYYTYEEITQAGPDNVIIYDDANDIVSIPEKSTFSVTGILLIVIGIAAVGAIIFIIFKKNKKEKEDFARQEKRESVYKNAGKQYEYAKTDTLVTCPHCGATAYPDSNNNCSYCRKSVK